MKIWLDDHRAPIGGYCWCRSVNEAKQAIIDCEKNREPVELVDLDYDLGDYSIDGGSGMRFLEWLDARGTYYRAEVHSTHIYGAEMMEKYITDHWPLP